jgi:hypothetical protein
MLTQVTAARTTRSIEVAEVRRINAEPALLFFRRTKDLAIHEAKQTKNGLPTRIALLGRAWVEHHSQPEHGDWPTSFANCCRMLGEDAGSERAKAVKDIDRAWRKALSDWARKQWQRGLEEIETMMAEGNPAWAARVGVQNELPLPEEL